MLMNQRCEENEEIPSSQTGAKSQNINYKDT